MLGDVTNGREGNLESDIEELLDGEVGYWKLTLRLWRLSIRQCLGTAYVHLEQTLFLGLNTFEERRMRELELVVLSGLESVVRLGLGNLSDEPLEVTAVSP